MRLTLRDYQTDALARVATAEARGVRRQVRTDHTGVGIVKAGANDVRAQVVVARGVPP
jgi:hypothetical protein